jgi:hypothetical protein
MIHFRQLRDEATSAYSYLLGCPETGSALVIDPVVNQTPLYLSRFRLRDSQRRPPAGGWRIRHLRPAQASNAGYAGTHARLRQLLLV